MYSLNFPLSERSFNRSAIAKLRSGSGSPIIFQMAIWIGIAILIFKEDRDRDRDRAHALKKPSVPSENSAA